jgi:small ligand-binding sensory domain FIST
MNASPTRRLFQRSSEAFRLRDSTAAVEIGPVGGKNFLHGFTASIALFVDPDANQGSLDPG